MRILISYRREDSAGHAGRLYDDLTEHFGPGHVFIDIDTIQPGADFTKAVAQEMQRSEVVLVVVGPRWLSVTDESGRRRLDDPGDYVRLEVEGALAREDVRLIPLLVQGAPMPAVRDLPESLHPFAYRNALSISEDRWRYDVGRLVQALDPKTAEPEDRPARMSRGRGRALTAAIAAGVVLIGGVVYALARGESPGTPPSSRSQGTTAPPIDGPPADRLLALIPEHIRGSCQEVTEPNNRPSGALATFDCGSGGAYASYSLFPTSAAVDDLYLERVVYSGVGKNTGACLGDDWPGEEGIEGHDSEQARVLCTQEEGHDPNLTWKRSDLMVYATAGSGGTREDLLEFWERAGPVGPGE